MPEPTQITAPRVPFLDQRTGLISREWFRFLLSLSASTGGSDLTLLDLQKGPDTDSAVSSLEANVNALWQALAEIPDANAGLASLALSLASVGQAAQSQPVGATVDQIAVLQSQIDALAVYPSATSGLAIPIPINQGGTGQITAPLAINALLPSQTSNSGKFLTTDGSVASWGAGGSAGVPNGTNTGANATSGGVSSVANGTNATSYGASSNATGENATAVGATAVANAADATALGKGAVASAANATAIGAGATSATANLITIGTAAETVSLIGGRLKFPATQITSSDANTLDDYEEGTWTPTWKFGGGNSGMTISISSANYTKTGNRCQIDTRIDMTTKGSSTGQMSLGGLPFACLNSGYTYGGGPFWLSKMVGTATIGAGTGTSTVDSFAWGANNPALVTDANVSNGDLILFSGQYPTAT